MIEHDGREKPKLLADWWDDDMPPVNEEGQPVHPDDEDGAAWLDYYDPSSWPESEDEEAFL